jgi:GTP cyclohydrolase I
VLFATCSSRSGATSTTTTCARRRGASPAYAELLTHEPVSLTTFPNDAGYDELVVVREIPFHSLRMHRLLLFHVAHVAYLPGERIVQKAGPRATTSALLGLLRDDARTRSEFLALVRGS